MRIISGKYKGLQLISPPAKSKAIRPTSDRCREALFSILSDKLNHAQVLDLYAGTGALALEALSRGAKSAVLVDNNTSACSLLAKNIQRLENHITYRTDSFPAITIVKSDLRNGLNAVIHSCKKRTLLPFDIVFLDPPYGKGLSQKTLEDLDNAAILATTGLIVAEERSKVVLSKKFEHFQCIDTRKYGDTTFWIYQTI